MTTPASPNISSFNGGMILAPLDFFQIMLRISLSLQELRLPQNIVQN